MAIPAPLPCIARPSIKISDKFKGQVMEAEQMAVQKPWENNLVGLGVTLQVERVRNATCAVSLRGRRAKLF